MVAAMGLMWWDIRRWARRVETRFRWMESHMTDLAKGAGIEIDPLGWVSPKVVDMVRRGEKLEAIKTLRKEELGLSLPEARDVVEAIAARRPDWWPAEKGGEFTSHRDEAGDEEDSLRG